MKLKKIFILGLSCVALMSVIGCSKNESTSNQENQEKVELVVKKRDIPEDFSEDCGNGAIEIVCEGGSSKDGNIPIIYVEKDTVLLQIGLNAESFDGTKLSYVYVDGILNCKEQFGELTQSTINLEGDNLSSGKHMVQVVQYKDNDINKEVLTYKEAFYSVEDM